jgi:hypothetical protein
VQCLTYLPAEAAQRVPLEARLSHGPRVIACAHVALQVTLAVQHLLTDEHLHTHTQHKIVLNERTSSVAAQRAALLYGTCLLRTPAQQYAPHTFEGLSSTRCAARLLRS